MIGPTDLEQEPPPEAAFQGESTRAAQSYWQESWQRLRGNRVGMYAGILILGLAVFAICAPLISNFLTHYTPTQQALDHNFDPPNPHNWLGADELGRDTLTRLIWGGRVTLGIGFLTVAITILVGGSVGLIAGYYGGWVDDILMRFVDIILAVPAIFLFILMSILFAPNTFTLSLIIASVAWGSVARLVRGETLSIKQRDFILATRSVGATDVRLMVRHLFPNVLPIMIVAASLGVGGIILTEAALDFLGLGIHQPTATWGNMLSNSQTFFVHSGWLVIFPGLMIFATVLAANLFGNAVRDAFDPRLK